MADNDIATRAPESDAQEKPQEQPQEPAEESVFPGDTRAQDGPSMGVSQVIVLTESCVYICRAFCRSRYPESALVPRSQCPQL
jgi:hypothetical protein